ncbi:Unconventional myosin-If [Frankliniella fusca]|uniref:Unconventional myosin-If n=1 Tax=Frankliniella fusca TaxID=407009 RepID=A0AAE1HE46_9NEOP|nr:Unconventional myosin-If [Frankliniella fusca]
MFSFPFLQKLSPGIVSGWGLPEKVKWSQYFTSFRNAAKRTKSFPVMGHSQDLSAVPSRGLRGSSAPHSATGPAPSSIPPQTPPAHTGPGTGAGVSDKL